MITAKGTTTARKNRLLRRLLIGASALVLIATGTAYAQQTPEQTQDRTQDQVWVLSVYDGDTFTIQGGERVRVLGINSPELRPAQCWGIQARDAARELLIGQSVVLTQDEQQGDKDRYGRELRYARLSNGADLGETLVRSGDAMVYEQFPVARTPQYREAQAAAQADHQGIWGACPS